MYTRTASRGRVPGQSYPNYSRPGSKGSVYGGNNLSYLPTSPMGSSSTQPGSGYSPQSKPGSNNAGGYYNNRAPCVTCCGSQPPWQSSPGNTTSSSNQRGIGAYPGHKPGTPVYSTTSRDQSQGVSSQGPNSSMNPHATASFQSYNSGNFQNLSSAAITPSAGVSPPAEISCTNNNYQALSQSQGSNYNGASQNSYGSSVGPHKMTSYPSGNIQPNYQSQQTQNNNYGGQSYSNMPQQQISIGNYQAMNNVRQQQQQMASGNYQFSREPSAPQQPVAFQTQALGKQPLAVGNYFASSSPGNNGGFSMNQQVSNLTDPSGKLDACLMSQGQSYLGGQTSPTSAQSASLGTPNSGRMNQLQSYQSSPSNQQYPTQQYTPQKSQQQMSSSSFSPHTNSHQMNSNQYGSNSSPNYQQIQQNHSMTMNSPPPSSSPSQVPTIRVGAPAPGQVLEPQTIRVQAPAPPPQSMETQMKIVLPKGMKIADPQALAQMAMDVQQGGDAGYGDTSANATTDDDPGGVKYIPLSWGELLGGGKDGLNGLKVIMSPPPAAENPNQNRQLRVAFGNQAVTTQPGEVPLKVVSINPVEGFKMGPVPGLEGDASSGTGTQSAMLQQQQQQQQQQQMQSQHQYPNRTQSMTAPIPPQIPTASSARTKMSSPNSCRIPQSGYSSPKMYSGVQSNSNINTNNALVKRLDFAGTKYY